MIINIKENKDEKTNGTLFSNSLKNFNKTVVFGIPEDTAKRDLKEGEKQKINNASLLYIMEKGSIPNNIDPRPVLKLAYQKNKDRIDKYMLTVSNAIVLGDTETAENAMKELALFIESAVKRFFADPNNGLTPNKPSTVKAWAKKHNKMKDFQEGTLIKKPLIDTGELRKAIRAMVIKEN